MKNNARKLSFNVDAYTARLIGRENVSKLEGAILEIVKNAYDADAKACCLYYSEKDSCIYIMDNGNGMTEDVLVTHWMTIGNSSKKNEYMSPKKRVQTGAKGIGRFALDRISDKCNMLTISEKGGLEWIVNWNDFNNEKTISDVSAMVYDSDASLIGFVGIDKWKNQNVTEVIKNEFNNTHGTVFILDGLHDLWNEAVVSNIRNHLENLMPPDVVKDFTIYFFTDKTSLENSVINSTNLDNFDYKISFQIDNDDLDIQIIRNEFEYNQNSKSDFIEAGFTEEDFLYFSGTERKLKYSIRQDIGVENCIGNYSGSLYFNKNALSKGDKAKFHYKDINGRPNLTIKFGGIKLYRDYFRVRPYGEYGDSNFDWLELSARRNRNPAGLGKSDGLWRVGADQLLGSVYISRQNKNLEDSANRNGIQEGVGFSQLKQILIFVINEFERDRQYVGRKFAELSKRNNKLLEEQEKIRQLAEERKKWEKKHDDKGDNDSGNQFLLNPIDVKNLLTDVENDKQRQIQDILDENKMLKTLATTGIITNMFMHEIRALTNNIGQELDSAFESIKYDNDAENALNNIRQAIGLKKNFSSWFGVTIESIRKDKRLRHKCNIKTVLSDFLKNWTDILQKNNIKIDFICDEEFEFSCYEFDIENIISNLISNSLASFDREMGAVLKDKRIIIEVMSNDDGFIINYRDTGWGLIEKYKRRPEIILEAFESSRNIMGNEDEGTGMGMWIVNKTVSEYNGEIYLDENRTAESGFYIKILFRE